MITGQPGEPQLIYVDLHLVHEVTSPQAFQGLRMNHRKVRRPDRTFATMDHNVPTKDIFNVKDLISKKQIETLRQNAKDFGIRLAGMGEADQGIIHVIGPQLGLTQPGQTIVCGDSHTSTHGAFGQLLLELGLQKSSTYLPPRPFGRLNPSRWHPRSRQAARWRLCQGYYYGDHRKIWRQIWCRPRG